MADDWRDSFQTWSRSGSVAHPDSPAGGSGNGFSRPDGFADHSWSDLPHPDSPAGRRVHWESELSRKKILADRSNVEKLTRAVERALPKLPRELRGKVQALLTPQALATLAAIAAVWGASHWIGVGEAVDIILLGWGVWTLGAEALDVAKDLYQFVTTATRAQTDEDLDQAASYFARAVAVIGIDGLAAILTHRAFKTFKETGPRGAPAPEGEVATTPREDAAAFSKQPAAPKERAVEPEETQPAPVAPAPIADDVAGSIRNVNPTGGTMNCVNCAAATDATLAGRPASALPGGATPIGALEQQFGGKFVKMAGKQSIDQAMQAAGPGARGIVFGERAGGIGHVFNVVNQGGVVRYLDGQTGQVASWTGFTGFRLLRTN